MEESNELAIMASPDQQGAIEVRQQVNQIQYLMKQVLREGEHYGVIPGTGNKPSLLQSGAEKIAYMFHLVPKYEINRTDHQGGHREYEVTCTLTSRDTGEVMGYGVGICSTLESKYRYRSKWVNGSKQRIENADIVLKAEDALLGRAVEQGGQAGEIVLLVVMAAARGMGMGKRLMREGAQWLAERGVAQVRLATDESCDWQVYEHLGMERVAQDTIGDDPSLEIYVYQMPTSALVKRLS
jgi:ribosomal protein S18 acetylase RimI-like enzyme